MPRSYVRYIMGGYYLDGDLSEITQKNVHRECASSRCWMSFVLWMPLVLWFLVLIIINDLQHVLKSSHIEHLMAFCTFPPNSRRPTYQTYVDVEIKDSRDFVK